MPRNRLTWEPKLRRHVEAKKNNKVSKFEFATTPVGEFIHTNKIAEFRNEVSKVDEKQGHLNR